MDTTSSTNSGEAAGSGSAFPTQAQAVAVTIAMLERGLQRLLTIRQGDEHWDNADTDVDHAIDLALVHTLRMKGMQFDNGDLFDREAYQVAAVLNMGVRLFSRQDCHYFRTLRAAATMLNEMIAMVEFVEAD